MSRLVETLYIEDFVIRDIEWHNSRFNRSRQDYFGVTVPLDLAKIIHTELHKHPGIQKCRILYGPDIEKIEFVPYLRRNIHTLRLIEDNTIEYSYKYEDRSRIEELLKRKGHADDIIIVQNGLLTDTSFSNIALFDGTNWFTPEQPLLKGTMREKLLRNNYLKTKHISVNDLGQYKKISLINTMLQLGEVIITPENIF